MASRDLMPNGVRRATRRLKRDANIRHTASNIAAIDFGTKNCSLAFVTGGTRPVVGGNALSKLPLNGTDRRVPTAILLNGDRDVVAFGHDARRRYAILDAREREEMYYFEGVKMNLAQDKDVHRDVTVRALNATEFRLVDVISYILGYLKTELLESHLNTHGYTFTAADFDWVVTVPAIWRARGKRMMREAAYLAGLGSKQFPERLSLALEPESAAIYCHEMLQQGMVAYPTAHPNPATPPPPSYSYLIVDIGGGTVDVSAHRVSTSPSRNVEELHPPVGGDWGGRKVNESFFKFLQKMVQDRNFSRFIQVNDIEEKNRNILERDELLNILFEEEKQRFGRARKGNRDHVVIKLPGNFMRYYGEALSASLQDQAKSLMAAGRHDEIVTLRESLSSLRIPVAKMEQFMQTTSDNILKYIRDLIHTLSTQDVSIDVIYLVGGFGGCQYIYERFQESFGQQRRIIVPPSPEYAIVDGAVLFRRNPAFVRSRKADATYGKSVVREFNSRIHDPHFRDGRFCKHLFQTIVSVGEVVDPSYEYVATSHPLDPGQEKIHFEVYSTKRPAHEVWYTRPIPNRDIQAGQEAGQDGREAGQEGCEAGQDGHETGQDDCEAGQNHEAEAGQDGREAGQNNHEAGQDDHEAGQDGREAGQDDREVVLIGELELSLPEVERWERENRELQIIFDFSHTEIQVRAHDKTSGAEVKTVMDFLSGTEKERPQPQPRQTRSQRLQGLLRVVEREGEGEGEREGDGDDSGVCE